MWRRSWKRIFPYERPRPEVHPAIWAAPRVWVGHVSDIAAALPPAGMAVAGDDAGAAQRRPQHVFERRLHRHDRAVGPMEDELRRGAIHGYPEIRHEFGNDGQRLGVTAFGRVAIVGAGNGDALAGTAQTIHSTSSSSPGPAPATLARRIDGGGEEPKYDQNPAVQTAVRLDPDLLVRPDAIAVKLSRRGLDVTRADATRIALITGLEKIEKE